MNKKLALKTVAPRDLWNVFRGCIWIILAAAILVTGIFYAVAYFRYTPVYSAKATMYLIGSENGVISGSQAADLGTAQRIMNDCTYLFKSRTVLNAVGEDVGIKNGYGALYSRITIKNPEDTRVLEISVTASSPEQAKKIVNSLCEHGKNEINRVLDFDKLSVFEPATSSGAPINTVNIISYAKYGLIAAVVVYIIFLAMFLFDNYIHNEEDIERYLGLTILGDIPDADAKQKKNKYKYGKYEGKYKSYRYYKRRGYRYHSNYGVNPRAYNDANAYAKAYEERETKKREAKEGKKD